MSDSAQNPVPQKPVVLCILDGWGDRGEAENNSIALAQTPNWDRYMADAPHARLKSCALDVGLPAGQMGNSEVGHMNIGAGRIVMQDLPRIDAALDDGSLAANQNLMQFIAALKQAGGACHLMGLISPGGVHSHQDQMAALVYILATQGIKVYLHAFLDGRDTPPRDGRRCLDKFLNDIDGAEGFSVATVSGRYYAMDRDHRWDRVSKAYDAMVSAEGETATNPLDAIDASYHAELTDEFMLPTVIGDFRGMADGDGLLMANFRADRAREILTALADPAFDGFQRSAARNFSTCLGLVEYSKDLNALFGVLFEPLALDGILGEVVANAGLKQLRIAETEKYAHVTFFLNGGREAEFSGEDRILVPSPKVATYDLQPEMSANEVTDKLTAAIDSGAYSLIVVNYANGDMVGHTGILTAAIKAAETLDVALGRLEASVAAAGGVLMVTADHGNCEEMINLKSGERHTQHTLNDVPVVLLNAPASIDALRDGRLSDVAPTLLTLLGLEIPSEMTGQSLLGGRLDDRGVNIAAAQ